MARLSDRWLRPRFDEKGTLWFNNPVIRLRRLRLVVLAILALTATGFLGFLVALLYVGMAAFDIPFLTFRQELMISSGVVTLCWVTVVYRVLRPGYRADAPAQIGFGPEELVLIGLTGWSTRMSWRLIQNLNATRDLSLTVKVTGLFSGGPFEIPSIGPGLVGRIQWAHRAYRRSALDVRLLVHPPPAVDYQEGTPLSGIEVGTNILLLEDALGVRRLKHVSLYPKTEIDHLAYPMWGTVLTYVFAYGHEIATAIGKADAERVASWLAGDAQAEPIPEGSPDGPEK